jgi:hypothetical protein
MLFTVIAFLPALLLGLLFKANSEKFASIGFCLSLFLLDFIYRWKNNEEEKEIRFIIPAKGAHIFFIPAWILALVGFGISVFM